MDLVIKHFATELKIGCGLFKKLNCKDKKICCSLLKNLIVKIYSYISKLRLSLIQLNTCFLC